jgi:hypothetical protein
VLVYKNTKLAVVEAKAWGKELTEGVAQAKSYAGKLEIRFTYATNGQGIYAVDMEEGKEGDAVSYPSPGELWGMTFAKKNEWRERFADVPFEDKGGFFQGRYDQGAGLLPPLLQARQLRVHFAQHLGNRSLFGERWELDLDQLQRLFVKRVTFHCLFSIKCEIRAAQDIVYKLGASLELVETANGLVGKEVATGKAQPSQ